MAAETPTIVLVHGAWADATGFAAEIRALRERGYTALGFGNPLRDLAGDAAYLAELLRTLSGPIVLVGHSYGGNVTPPPPSATRRSGRSSTLTAGCATSARASSSSSRSTQAPLWGPSIRPVPFTNPD